MKNLSDRSIQGGQALLVVLLVLSVVLTVALSAVSRSITDISISTSEEESLRAFSAAEAGIEEALVSSGAGGLSGAFGERTSYDVTFPSALPIDDKMVHPREFLSGETATLWFVSQDEEGIFHCGTVGMPCVKASHVEFCWGAEASEIPAVEISLYYDSTQSSQDKQDYSGIKISRRVFDPDNTRKQENGFDLASTSCSFDPTLKYSSNSLSLSGAGNDFNIDPTTCTSNDGCLLFARVRFFYNNSTPQPIGLAVTIADPSDTNKLPAQGVAIESTGHSGESARKVNVFQSFAEPPEIFDSAVFSLNNLIKTTSE